MKKLFVAVLLALASLSRADSAYGYIEVRANDLMQGDGITFPLSAASTDAVFFSSFKNNSVLSLTSVTGVSFTASIKLPTNINPAYPVYIGVTGMYSGVTNSVVLSATAQVQNVYYMDNMRYQSNTLTSTTKTVFRQYPVTSANFHQKPTEAELGSVTAFSGNYVTVYVERIAGTHSLFNIYSVFCRYTPTMGYGPW